MDLIVTLDDATNEVYSMILVAEEGTASTLRALREVIAAHGLFCALYTGFAVPTPASLCQTLPNPITHSADFAGLSAILA
jgi:hypothetical protein